MRTCEIEDCDAKHYGKGLCNRHYMQEWTHGKIVLNNAGDRNTYRVDDDVAHIALRNRKRELIVEVMVDVEDIEKCLQHKWCCHVGRYAATRAGPKLMFMHRFILGVPHFKDFRHIVDHISGNGFDNRKENLRITTQSVNLQNTGMWKNNTSGIKGVYWDKSKQRWLASIGIDGKSKFIGRFREFEGAVQARKQAEMEYFYA